jgi:hypothetical protein
MDKRHDVGIRFSDPRRGAAIHDGGETRSNKLDIWEVNWRFLLLQFIETLLEPAVDGDQRLHCRNAVLGSF